ncbi:hypothetical protein PYCCODRAFT_945619 [Trametes coccinea BRFM310]|uniref:Uncharacterized protein n=1 Tax=Trametes coccinea (strain BRFM310) TaxID=1353009 RepID=A0A1Y2IZH6_TRAC3|nr:hypothetical protein PYCCODRAFT_945619 [Trametes coccinea BRFM310]
MKSFAALASAALLAVAVSAQQFTINTPNPPTVCVPVQLTWSGGTRIPLLPGNIFPGGHPEEQALQQYPNLEGTSFTWSTNITAGTLVGFQLTDHNGQIAQSSSVQIMSGPDTSCLTGGSSASSSAGSTGTTSAAAGTSTGTATAPAGSSTSAAGGSSAGSSAGSGTSHAASGTSASTSASASATGGSSNNGGFVNAASIGAVGVLSAVAALVLA